MTAPTPRDPKTCTHGEAELFLGRGGGAHCRLCGTWARFDALTLTRSEPDPRETDGSTPENPRPDGTYGWPKGEPAGAGTCWFCKGRFVVDALIAGYDTWDEQRLACLACNERMRGNWRLAADPPADPEAGR